MPGKKPGSPKTGGRIKGTPNKFSSDVKAMVLEALGKAGGVEYLVTQSNANPVAFMALVGKVLPMSIANADDKPFELTGSIELRAVYPKK